MKIYHGRRIKMSSLVELRDFITAFNETVYPEFKKRFLYLAGLNARHKQIPFFDACSNVLEYYQEDKKSPYNGTFDLQCEIVLLPHDDGYVYFIPLAQYKEYFAAIDSIDGVEEFAFWNNVDAPFGIDEEEFWARQEVWEKVLGKDGVPATNGMSHFLVGDYIIFTEWDEYKKELIDFSAE